MYGIIKILIATSSIKIIGTTSIVGNINASPETEIAENPKPLKPLTVAATSIMIIIKIKFVKLNSKFTNSADSNMSATNMGRLFVESMEGAFKNWKPKNELVLWKI